MQPKINLINSNLVESNLEPAARQAGILTMHLFIQITSKNTGFFSLGIWKLNIFKFSKPCVILDLWNIISSKPLDHLP